VTPLQSAAPIACQWPEVLVVVGPTASGKSAVAIELADMVGGEVVNADAYQVYRGMDVGTAKPTAADRGRVPHHLLDILDVTDELSVAQYQHRARDALRELAARGVPAVVVGGSGLYVRALVDDLRFPGRDPQVRARWEAELARLGPTALHAVLAERDPEAADHILPSNGRRIVRALEVGEMTGEGFTATLPVDGPPLVGHQSYGLDIDRSALDQRISGRVTGMFDAGLVDEVRSLLAVGLREGRTASRALGYPQVVDLLDGVIDRATAHQRIVAATRAYARRQQRWFRRDPRTQWLPAEKDPRSTASTIMSLRAAVGRTLGP
jgi:tRNA dimethylallyltransferase